MRNLREEWLQKSIADLKSGLFKRAGYKLPKVRVSVGFAGGRGAKKAIGQHWAPEASSDKVGQIFIHPSYNDANEVLAILVHELVHAAVHNKHGHGPVFKKCALAVGLEGKMRSTTAGAQLKKELKKLSSELGRYPHGKLNLGMSPIKKQSTRMVKMLCSECGYIARTSQTNIDNFGTVKCPCNDEPMEVDVK